MARVSWLRVLTSTRAEAGATALTPPRAQDVDRVDQQHNTARTARRSGRVRRAPRDTPPRARSPPPFGAGGGRRGGPRRVVVRFPRRRSPVMIFHRIVAMLTLAAVPVLAGPAAARGGGNSPADHHA